MPHHKIDNVLREELEALAQAGTRKGRETVITGVIAPVANKGPRYLLEGEGGKRFLRMNANSYLGLSLRREVQETEERAVRAYGTGPGAVRFISGTWAPHVELEQRLAAFHGREEAMIFSSAYSTVMGVLPALITPETAVISDELNHNCIINAVRLAHPKERYIYPHLSMDGLKAQLDKAVETCRRIIIITDGIFSMRGDHAPLSEIVKLAQQYDEHCLENVLVIIDDSHGVGAFGATGRGTEEYTGCESVDLLIATLGKAVGVNGGYLVANRVITDYLRERTPFYIYSNPITPAEAAAAVKALEIIDSERGLGLLNHLREMTARFENGLVALGFETIPGEHPIVPLMVRDTVQTSALVKHLNANGILATGLNYPVVPRGDEEIRFQISADHTASDIDEAVTVLAKFAGQ
jgi:glycine C-acetyltransferase